VGEAVAEPKAIESLAGSLSMESGLLKMTSRILLLMKAQLGSYACSPVCEVQDSPGAIA
jgi:hypothetical protein